MLLSTMHKSMINALNITFIFYLLLPVQLKGESFLETINKAYENSLEIKGNALLLRSQKAQSFSNITQYLPSIEGSSEIWQHNNELTNEQYREQQYLLKGKINQSILDIQKMTNIIESRKNKKINIENNKLLNQNSFREIIIVWINYNLSLEQLKLSQLADSLSSRHLEATQKRFESGDLTKTDIYQAQTRYYSNHSKLLRDENSVKQNKKLYLTKFAGILNESSTIPSLDMNKFNDQQIDSLLNTHPEIIILKERISIAKAKHIRNSTKYLPQIQGVGEISANWDKSISYKPYPYNDMAVGLEVSVNIFESGKVVSDAISSKALKDREVLLLEDFKAKKRDKITNLNIQIEKLKMQLQNIKNSEEAARKSLEGITIEFNIGNRNSMNVMDAQTELTEVQVEYLNGKIQYFLTCIDFLYSLGILNKEVLENYLTTEDKI